MGLKKLVAEDDKPWVTLEQMRASDDGRSSLVTDTPSEADFTLGSEGTAVEGREVDTALYEVLQGLFLLKQDSCTASPELVPTKASVDEVNELGALQSANKNLRLTRCGSCEGCVVQDCGTCKNCADKPKYGGPGVKKQACVARKCITPQVRAFETSAGGYCESSTDVLSTASTVVSGKNWGSVLGEEAPPSALKREGSQTLSILSLITATSRETEDACDSQPRSKRRRRAPVVNSP